MIKSYANDISRHSVVGTVRSQAKADKIKKAHSEAGDKLSFVIVEDIAQPGAFDKAVVSDPPFEAVLHTASPFHFNVKDVQKELLDPAVIGTTGCLKAIKAHAPSVKRVVITSSFAAIINPHKGLWPGHTYSESDWNPLTQEEAVQNPSNGYRASKTFAERAAWEFVEKEKPNFTISTINPPLVFGPVVNYLNDSLDALNTSNERVRDLIQGKSKGASEIPETGIFIWVDVRDIANAHVKAMGSEEAAGKRFFIVADKPFCNRDLVNVVRKDFPQYADKLPKEDATGGDFPDKFFDFDNSRSKKILGMEYMKLDKSIKDLVVSLEHIGV